MSKFLSLALLCAFVSTLTTHARPYFNASTDLLICQYDSKPDPDDIHSQAAAGCMLAHADHAAVNYYAVQGAYGIQGGAFIDSDSLFNMAFGAQNTYWTDADADWWGSVTRIKNKAKTILQNGGKVWVAEAGQSNITADWIYALIQDGIAEATIKANVIVVQHSEWNQDQTATADLNYVQDKSDYYYIDDGNAPWGSTSWGDHGPYTTPQYNNASTIYLTEAKAASNPNTTAKALWTEADYICDNQPYHPDWSNITPGGVDFSDTVEIWWILNVQDAGTNQDGFWDKYVTNTPQGGGTDSVDETALPASIESATSYTVSVPYEASTSRDIVVEIWDSGWRGQGTTTVSAGSGNATVTVPVYNGVALTVGTGYIWKTHIRPVGADWTQNIDGGSMAVEVTSGGGTDIDSVDGSLLPTSIEAATSYQVSIPYTTIEDRDIWVDLWLGSTWVGGTKVDANLRSGTASATVNCSTAPAAGTGYYWKVYMTEDGQNWQFPVGGDTGSVQINNVTVTSGGGIPTEDTVEDQSLPTAVASDTSYTVNVAYTATTTRDVCVEIWDSGWRGQATVTVSAGSGTVEVTVPVYNGVALTPGTGYIWKTHIREHGGDWTTNIEGGSQAFEVTGGGGGGTVIETPTQDAYIQGSTPFNNSDLKVEPNYRVSYLKFDVSGISGTATDSKLVIQLTEAGSGTIRVHQGNSNLNWTEGTLTAATAPGQGTELGSVSGTFSNSSTVEIDLGTSIGNGEITLVVTMDSGGNDIWCSSSEGANSPRLEVTYQ